jgi:CRP/FNR family cyclic AMP-dependent transcriptional regulator
LDTSSGGSNAMAEARESTLASFLRTVPLFEALDDEERGQILAIGRVRSYPQGAHLLEDGAPGGHLHVVHQGCVRIGKTLPTGVEEALALLGPGEIFGEVEFFDGSPASAQAVAHEPCEVFSIPHDEMLGLLKRRPELCAKFLWTFGKTLAVRLRDMNERIAALFVMSRAF